MPVKRVPPLSDLDLHRAFLENRRVAVQSAGGGVFEERDGWQLYDSGTGLDGLNQAMAIGTLPAMEDLELAAEWYRARGTGYCLVLRDSDDWQLISSARESGFRLERSQPVMTRRLPCPALALPGLALQAVEGPAAAREFLAVRRDPTKIRPPDDTETDFILRVVRAGTFRYFVAELGGKAVGTVTSSLAGEIAIIANLFVVPANRRRGLGADITARAAASWPEANHVALEASREGAMLYASMGFERRYSYVRLVPSEAT